MASVSITAFASSKKHNIVGNPLVEEEPTNLGDMNYLTPSKSEPESKPNSEISTMNSTLPIDFSTLTAVNFGITPGSFTKQNKEQSKSLLNKFKRRSTIGVRGSPENNSLIRYIAHQRQARKQDALAQVSPFKHQNTFLKDKIAAFETSFKPLEEVEERQIHIAETSKEINEKPHKQPELGQISLSACERVVFEENETQKSINRRRTSADIQEHKIVSPSPKLSLAGTADTLKGVSGLLANSTKSGRMILETTPVNDVSRTVCDVQYSHAKEELKQNATPQQSCKKVRFAEKQNLEIFDETMPPITPKQRDHLSSYFVRSVLKKTPVRVETRGKKAGVEHHCEHVDDTKKKEFSAGLDSIPKERSARPEDEVMVKNEDLSSDVHDAPLPVAIPLHKRRRLRLSSSGSRESSPDVTPGKQSFSQPDFDRDDDRESSEIVSTPGRAANCDLEETTASLRITRSSAKRKHVSSAEEKDCRLTNETQIKNSKHKPKEIQKTKSATKSSQKKKPAARCKVFGKRRRRKKEQKALYGQREIVSKIPLLSPIPEVTEDISVISSENTPASQISIFDFVLDDSILSALHGEPVNGTDENRHIVHSDKEDGDCLHPSPDLLKGLDSMSDSISQFADDATNALKNIVPLDSPKKNYPEELKTIIHENEEVLENDCTSGKAEMQEKLELLHLQGAGKNIKTKGAALFSIESAPQLISENDDVNFKKFPRRSRRLASYLPHSEIPGNISSPPESKREELPPASDNSELLHGWQCCTEESFNNTSRRVRRSMRRHKDAEDEGLVWIQISANNFKGQAPLDSACNVQRQMSSSGPQESELLHQKEISSIQLPFIVSEEQENAHVPAGPRKLKRRKSFGVLSARENDTVVLHAQRKRRASLGYKSDYCYRKSSEMRKFSNNQSNSLDCYSLKGEG